MKTPEAFLRQRMNLRHLRLILTLAEERSVSRAAARLCISQAAVSKMRAEIELGIGGPLFERDGRFNRMTPLGQCLLDGARRITSEMERMTEEFVLLQSGKHGVLSIGVRTVSGQPLLARVIAQFKQAHPLLTIQLIDMDLPTLLDRLHRGEISLLLARFDPTYVGAGVDGHTIMSDRSVVVASPNHPILKRDKITWEELVGCTWCLPPEGYAGRFAREYLSGHLAMRHVPFPTNVVEAQSSILLLINIFQSGDFLTLIPQGVAMELEALGLVRMLDIEPVGPEEPLRIMWRDDQALSAAARRFRDFMIETLDIRNPTREGRSAPATSQSYAAIRTYRQ